MSPDVLKHIHQLRFLLSKKSHQAFLGFYRSAFKGTGVTFRDFREYCIGDDVRSISWPLTARMGRPYVKVFEEDRGNTFILMVDVSASSFFGTQNSSKLEVIRSLASVIALSTELSQDQISLLLFSDRVEHYVPPSKGRKHTMRVIRDLYSYVPESKKTSYQKPCAYLRNILKKKCYIFVLSDFLSSDVESSLKLLRQAHQLTAIVVEDPFEKKFPPLGLIDFEDIESGEQIILDTSSLSFQKDYPLIMENIKNQRNKKFKRARADYFYVQTDQDIFKPFLQFMKFKES